MTAPQAAYTPARRSSLYDKDGRERARVKRCPNDRAVLTEGVAQLSCPECGWTVERLVTS